MIYIDAHIFLDFYGNVPPGLKQLLPTLVELRDQLIIPRQIVDEVRRNAVKKVADDWSKAPSKLNVPNMLLPVQHEQDGVNFISEWNAGWGRIQDEAEELEKKSKALIGKILSDVQHGRDPVSEQLRRVFEVAKDADEAILEAARLRRERGNPPGKKGDPLGDQLSWEVLLSRCSPASDLWIVSRDGDYGHRFEKKLYLNAFLQEELDLRLSGRKVHAFDNLAEAMRDYNKTLSVAPKTLPSEITLEKIAKEAQDAHPDLFPPTTYSAHLLTCPRCGKENALVDCGPKPSVYGGWTYKLMCRFCGNLIDTGEPYDD